jgi:hypothetical protein
MPIWLDGLGPKALWTLKTLSCIRNCIQASGTVRHLTMAGQIGNRRPANRTCAVTLQPAFGRLKASDRFTPGVQVHYRAFDERGVAEVFEVQSVQRFDRLCNAREELLTLRRRQQRHEFGENGCSCSRRSFRVWPWVRAIGADGIKMDVIAYRKGFGRNRCRCHRRAMLCSGQRRGWPHVLWRML